MIISPSARVANIERGAPTERKVFALIAIGLTDKEIARDLGLSFPAVRFHVGRIFIKIGATNRVQAALEFHGIDWRKEPT